MNEGMRADELQKKVDDLNKEKGLLLSDIEKRQESIAATSDKIKDLETKNQEDTKQLIDDLKAQIQENQERLKTSQEEIARLNKVIEDTSEKLAQYSQVVRSQMTPWFSSELQKNIQDQESQNIEVSSEKWEKEQEKQNQSENNSQASPLEQQTSIPEIPSQVAPDGQNNPQEQVPQTVPVAPVVQPENTQPAQNLEVAPQQDPQIENQPQLTDAQKLAQVQQILGNLESKFISLQAESNSITLTAAEFASLDQASNLLQQDSMSQSTADQRALLINDEDARKDYIKELKEQIKAEKKASKDLKKIRDLQEKLAQVSNHNNYNLNVMNSLSGINSVLQNGTYLDTKFQIPREQKFALELIKKRDLLRSWAVVPLTIDGRTVEVYNGAFVGQSLQTWLRIDNCNQPVNILEKFLTENTKMDLGQARSATKTITTVGVLAGAFYGLKWLLGNTDKEGNRSFGLSPKKFLGAAAVLLWGNMASQMATGRGALDLINEFWRTGNNPFTSETYEKAQPIEQISLDQTALQMALLGVPYAQLSQFTSPKSWPITSIDLASLQRYYEAQELLARQNNLNDKIQQIGAQISAIKDEYSGTRTSESRKCRLDTWWSFVSK